MLNPKQVYTKMSILNFFRKLIYREVPDNNDLDDAIIISCYFNPLGSPYRLKAFNRFYEGIKQYNHKIVECVIGEAQPELSDDFEKIHTKSLLWHKETLLNKIIAGLPKKYKYIFWVDADLIFTNPNWVEEGVQAMKAGANMIQPFEYCIHLEKDLHEPNFNVNAYRKDCYNPVTRHKMLWRSFCSNHSIGLSAHQNYDIHGHVGFAWGIKREIIEKVPGYLYDKALIGGADHIMAHAGAGHINHNCITKSFTANIEEVNEWSRMFYNAVEGKLGFVKGDVYHIWHGDLKDRQYLKRIQEFTAKSKKIQKRDENGFYIGEDDDINDYMNNYFLVREALDDSYTEISKSNSNFVKTCISLDSDQQFDDLSQINIIEETIQIFPNEETIQQDTTNYNIPDNDYDDDYQGSTFS